MFSFLFRRGDAFQQRRKQQDVWKCMRRLVDMSSPNMPHAEGQSRSDNRCNRCLPVLIVPFVDEESGFQDAIFAVTSDCSDEGASLLSTHRVTTPEVICAFWDDGPIFLRGDVRQVRPFGAGFWQSGVRFSEVLPSGQLQMLYSLAAQLVPGEPDDDSVAVELAAATTR